MAHFAELDNNNIVLRVLVVANHMIIDDNGEESEQMGIDHLNSVLGESNWVQTSYNNNFRMRYAGPGMVYYPEQDGFGYTRPEEFPSWVLNVDTLEFEPPIPMPEQEGYFFLWDESSVSWISMPITDYDLSL